MKTWHADGPIRSIADIEALERIPLDQRFESWDINKWIGSGCGIRPEKNWITFFSDGDPTGPASTLTYAEARSADQKVREPV